MARRSNTKRLSLPFFSSTVTVSFWHFIRNLQELARVHVVGAKRFESYLTSFMIATSQIVYFWILELFTKKRCEVRDECVSCATGGECGGEALSGELTAN
jgi:hypothetical protein